MNGTKSAVTSVGFWGPLVAAVVVLLQLVGVDIAEDAAGLPEKLASTVDSVMVLVAVLAGLYGRLKATEKITGLFKAK